MSFVAAKPAALAASAADLARIGSAITTGNAAATSIAEVAPAAADRVSVLTAAQFSTYGRLYHLISSQAEQVLHRFVETMRAGAGAYASTEACSTAGLSA